MENCYFCFAWHMSRIGQFCAWKTCDPAMTNLNTWDIVLINLCTRELPFNPIAQITFLSSDMMHLMPRSR
eukprot:500101-Pelagomonas_calceolata.AAC.1